MLESGWRHLIDSFWRQPVVSLKKSASSLYWWFRSPVGSRMLAQERELIDQCRKEYKGQTMLQVSGAGVALMGNASMKRSKIQMYPGMPSKVSDKLDAYGWLVSELEQMPLPDESVDFLILHHSLEFAEDPHAVLREATRVLSPQGHLLIICFNPYSLFGLRKSMQLILRKAIPWAHHGLSRRRVSDWLRLMNCDPLNVAFGFYPFPVQSERFLKFFDGVDRFLANNGMIGGGFYVIHACKEVGGWVGSIRPETPSGQLVKFPQVAATRNFKQRD